MPLGLHLGVYIIKVSVSNKVATNTGMQIAELPVAIAAFANARAVKNRALG